MGILVVLAAGLTCAIRNLLLKRPAARHYHEEDTPEVTPHPRSQQLGVSQVRVHGRAQLSIALLSNILSETEVLDLSIA